LDWYGEGYSASSPGRDPAGPADGWKRVIRGGSWDYEGWICRAAFRSRYTPGIRHNFIGFRAALVLSG
jgi:formylglycine-generating enzyme required for sulfatase activity